MKQKVKPSWASIAILVFGISLTVAGIIIIQQQTANILKDKLRERLTQIAATAELSLDTKLVAEAKVAFDEPSLKKLAQQLRNIRAVNPKTKYVYILLPTNKQNEMQFLLDADSFDPIDWDGNGKIDELEIPPDPGEMYDTTDSPMLNVAMNEATADYDLTEDQWGTFLSGYAPIREGGQTLGVLGLDVDVADYMAIIQSTLVPFSLLLGLLILILTLQTYWLVRIWNARVKLVEELDQKKDAVISMVAHQFRGPISHINTYVELLLGGDCGPLTDEQKESITVIRSASQRLSGQSDLVLDAAKIKLGKLPVEPIPLDLNGFFKDIVNEALLNAKEKKVDLAVSIPAKLPIALLDLKHTQLAMDNLLSNAVKYTALKKADSGKKVEFSVEANNNILFCTVKDSGIGIPEKDQDKVMIREMYRSDNAGKDGNGIGLYVTKGVIEAQGGTIRFESKENVGTTFFVELPLKIATKEDIERQSAQEKKGV